jgi:hypothetical protein
MSIPTNGRFVWHDFMTADAKAAAKFYTQLFGWKTRDVDMGPDGTYTIISAGEREIGGFWPMKQKDVPPHWVGYVATDDVDGLIEKAKAQGATVHVPPQDIPKIGRFAVLADAQGAVFSPMKFAQLPPEVDRPATGTFCWDELLTTDPEAAKKFYVSLFGYATEAKDMGPMGTYTIFKRGERMSAGMMKLPEQAQKMGAPPHWLVYVAVDNVDTSSAKAQGLGAKELVAPQDIPNLGRFAILQDPFGAVFAVFKGTM